MNLFATILVVSAVIAATVAVPVNVPSLSFKDIQNEIEFLSHHHSTNLSIPHPMNSDRNAETAEKLRCRISAIDKANETHNLGDGWENTRPKLVKLADNLEQCTNQLCSLVYYLRATYVLVTYLDDVEKHNPEAREAINDQIIEQCYNSDDPESAEAFRCHISAIDTVDETHNLGERWAQTKMELAPIVEAWEKCADKECTTTHAIAATSVLGLYLEEVKETKPDAYEAIDEQVNEQCKK